MTFKKIRRSKAHLDKKLCDIFVFSYGIKFDKLGIIANFTVYLYIIEKLKIPYPWPNISSISIKTRYTYSMSITKHEYVIRFLKDLREGVKLGLPYDVTTLNWVKQGPS